MVLVVLVGCQTTQSTQAFKAPQAKRPIKATQISQNTSNGLVVTGARIMEYGIYEADISIVKTRGSENKASVKVHKNTNHKLTTTNIYVPNPLDKDIRFGYRFRLDGSYGEKVMVKLRAIHPPSKAGVTESSDMRWRNIGRNYFLTWNIEPNGDGLKFYNRSGIYTLQVLYNGKIVSSKSFEVIEKQRIARLVD